MRANGGRPTGKLCDSILCTKGQDWDGCILSIGCVCLHFTTLVPQKPLGSKHLPVVHFPEDSTGVAILSSSCSHMPSHQVHTTRFRWFGPAGWLCTAGHTSLTFQALFVKLSAVKLVLYIFVLCAGHCCLESDHCCCGKEVFYTV